MLVSAISKPVTIIREEVVQTAKTAGAIRTAGTGKKGKESKGNEYPRNLAQVPYILYSVICQKKFMLMLAFFELNSEINAIYLTLTRKLGLPIKPTNVGIQKIDGYL